MKTVRYMWREPIKVDYKYHEETELSNTEYIEMDALKIDEPLIRVSDLTIAILKAKRNFIKKITNEAKRKRNFPDIMAFIEYEARDLDDTISDLEKTR